MGGNAGKSLFERHAGVLRALGHDAHSRLGDVEDVADVFLQHELAGLDLREVEQVVDQVQQQHAAFVNVADVAVVLRRAERPEQLRLEDLREAEDGVQGRAQLVADIGEELRLGGVGGLGPLAVGGVLAGESRHLGRQLLHLPARLAEVLDRALQPLLAVAQQQLLVLQPGDVGPHADGAAVLRAVLADQDPAAVAELLQHGGDGIAMLRETLGHPGLDPAHGLDILAALRALADDLLEARARLQQVGADGVEVAVFAIAQAPAGRRSRTGRSLH